MKRLALLAAIVAALTVSSAASATTPIYWTPAKMVAALTALQYPHAGIINGACKGVGKPRHRTFAAFKCSLGWQITTTAGTLETGHATVWAKPLPSSRVCGSASSLGACKTVPRRGTDPRICSFNNAEQCGNYAARAAFQAHYPIVNGQPFAGSLDCPTAAAMVYRCEWSNGTGSGIATVTFARGVFGWTTTVTP